MPNSAIKWKDLIRENRGRLPHYITYIEIESLRQLTPCGFFIFLTQRVIYKILFFVKVDTLVINIKSNNINQNHNKLLDSLNELNRRRKKMGDIVFIINAVITVFIFIIRMNVVDGQEEDILLQQQHRQQQQVASSLRNLKQAYMEIVFYTEDVGNGGFLTTTYQIKGKFAKYGTHFAAEGRLKKVRS